MDAQYDACLLDLATPRPGLIDVCDIWPLLWAVNPAAERADDSAVAHLVILRHVHPAAAHALVN